MIVLDTNVLSEVIHAQPDLAVARWLTSRPASSLFMTAISQAELLYGLQLLPEGRRRRDLAEAIESILHDVFHDRILPFDGSAARAYATIAVERRTAGRPIDAMDAQIAAIARSRDAHVATRNVDDFADCGIGVVNPWTPGI